MKVILDEINELIGGETSMSPYKTIQSEGGLTKKNKRRYAEQTRISKGNGTIFKTNQELNSDKTTLVDLCIKKSNSKPQAKANPKLKKSEEKEISIDSQNYITKKYTADLVENNALTHKEGFDILKNL